MRSMEAELPKPLNNDAVDVMPRGRRRVCILLGVKLVMLALSSSMSSGCAPRDDFRDMYSKREVPFVGEDVLDVESKVPLVPSGNVTVCTSSVEA